MPDIPDGFYLDPFDPEIYREWADGRWTASTRTGPEDSPADRHAAHVGASWPLPGQPKRAERDVATRGTETSSENSSWDPALLGAIFWAVVAAIVGGSYIFGTQDISYGGDAYTGIQNAGAQTVRAVGWLIVATGPLGIITALSRRR